MIEICNYCIEFMRLFSDLFGISYGQANCILFNILEPGVCILLLMAALSSNPKFIKTTHILSWGIAIVMVLSFALTLGHGVTLCDIGSANMESYLEHVVMFENTFLDKWCLWTIAVLYDIAGTLSMTYAEINVWIYCIILPLIALICYFISKIRLVRIKNSSVSV